MSKVIGFIGSPRKSGNTSSIVNEVLRGASENGASVKVYHLDELDIKGCKGCLYCRKHEGCAIKDDMQAIYTDLKDADALVIGSPVYICQVSGQTKIMLDRFYPLTTNTHKPRFGNKKVVTVYSHAAPLPGFFSQYMDYTEKHLKPMGLNIIKRIIATRAVDRDTASKNRKLMDEAYGTGKALATGIPAYSHESFIKRFLKRLKGSKHTEVNYG